MHFYPAVATRRFFRIETRDRLDGSARSFKLRELEQAPGARQALSRGSADIPVWISLPSGGGNVRIEKSLMSLPDMAVFEGLPAFLDRLRALGDGKSGSPAITPILKEILLDSRISGDEKLSVITAPAGREVLAEVVEALPMELYPVVRKILDLDTAWLDPDCSLSDRVQRLTEVLCSAEELAHLRSERSRLVLAREVVRKKAEADRLALQKAQEEEKARQEQLNREREQALRNALTLGRGNAGHGEFRMTDEFLKVFRLVEAGERLLFVTGKPGTGKSTLIRALRDRLSGRNLVVLSFTGTAALNVGGQTINSFFSMPLQILEEGWVPTTWSFRRRAQALEVLVIDEVSMLRPDMLDAINSSLKAARGDSRPFGGVQVVLVGDLLQLPPVLESDPAIKAHYEMRYKGERFFYAAKVLKMAQPGVVELTKVFRQGAGEFLDFLSAVREGKIDGEQLDWFNAKLRAEEDFPDSVFYLTVMPHRRTAAQFNAMRLDRLAGPERTWSAYLIKNGEKQQIDESEQKKYPADLHLRLRPKAQVMFVKNDDGKHWVNGDLGIVEDFDADWIRVTNGNGTWRVERTEWPIIKYDIDPESHRLIPRQEGAFIQFPLSLAWASTIHKMQGQTVDRIKIDLTGGAFESGMTYVALSRCRTLEGIRLTRSLLQADLITDEKVMEYLAGLRRL